MKKVPHKTYLTVMALYAYRCYSCSARADDLHHRLSRTNANIEKYPLFIHSPMNLIPLCRNCHINRKNEFRISEREAEVYEKYMADSRAKRY